MVAKVCEHPGDVPRTNPGDLGGFRPVPSLPVALSVNVGAGEVFGVAGAAAAAECERSRTPGDRQAPATSLGSLAQPPMSRTLSFLAPKTPLVLVRRDPLGGGRLLLAGPDGEALIAEPVEGPANSTGERGAVNVGPAPSNPHLPPTRRRISINDLLDLPTTSRNISPARPSGVQPSLAKIAPKHSTAALPLTVPIRSLSLSSSSSTSSTSSASSSSSSSSTLSGTTAALIVNSLVPSRNGKVPIASLHSTHHHPHHSSAVPSRRSSSASAAGTVSASRAARRAKSSHNQAERARRQHLNEKIKELQSLLPGASAASTCETLQLAAQYIDRLASVTALFQRELNKIKEKR